MIKNTNPLHPGEVLNEVYMKEMGLNQSQLAELCNALQERLMRSLMGSVESLLNLLLSLSLQLERVLKCG